MAKHKGPTDEHLEYERWVDSFNQHCSEPPAPLQFGIICFEPPRHVSVGLWMRDDRTEMGVIQVCAITFPMRFCDASAAASIFAAAAQNVAGMLE